MLKLTLRKYIKNDGHIEYYQLMKEISDKQTVLNINAL